MWKGFARFATFAATLPLLASCEGFLAAVPVTSTITLRFVNMSEEFDVRVELFTSEEDDIPEEVLTNDNLNVGGHSDFTVPPGQSQDFSRSCEDVRAVAIGRAQLQILGPIDPDDDTRVLRDGEDFGCGDLITFTLIHSDVLTDFRISTVVSSPDQAEPDEGGGPWLSWPAEP